MKLSLITALLLAGCAVPIGPEAADTAEEADLETPTLDSPDAREAILTAQRPAQPPCCCLVEVVLGYPPVRESCASADPARGTCVATDGRSGEWLGEACQ